MKNPKSMLGTITHHALPGLMAGIVALALVVRAAEQPAPPPAPSKSAGTAKQVSGYPIHGKLTAVDPQAMTFALKGVEKDPVFRVNAQTRITKGGRSAALTDGVMGDIVAGYVDRQPDGTLMARSLRFGPASQQESNGNPKKTKP